MSSKKRIDLLPGDMFFRRGNSFATDALLDPDYSFLVISINHKTEEMTVYATKYAYYIVPDSMQRRRRVVYQHIMSTTYQSNSSVEVL